MNNRGEFDIGFGAMMVLILIAGYAAVAWENHEKTQLKMKALEKGCTPAQIEALTK